MPQILLIDDPLALMDEEVCKLRMRHLQAFVAQKCRIRKLRDGLVDLTPEIALAHDVTVHEMGSAGS
jgi:hypothetical protein